MATVPKGGATGHRQARSSKLEDQAANAALYVTSPNKGAHSNTNYPLDADNKLSAAGAATSLKYADPHDLPSFPSVGLASPDASAGTAATLANTNQTTFEYWKPDPSSAASKAAMLAKDYKPAPLWHPEASTAGSKAALLAARDGGNVHIWRPEATQEGNSAAGQAMRNKTLSPQIDYGYTPDGSRRALMAATGAMAGSRKRAGSSPVVVNSPYPDSVNSAANALNAATVAHKPSTRNNDTNKVRNAALTNMSREMYTSHPPVAPEVEEKNRQAGLHAAAISMAKQMYNVQQRAIEQASSGSTSHGLSAANAVHKRRESDVSSEDGRIQSPQHANLHEAAQKLAAERLAKLRDEHAEYRSYYGTNAPPPQSRLSLRARPRRRASSDGQTREMDQQRSQQIRSEMSIFNDKLAQVDAKKRQQDRDALLAAAQRNVRASMHGMDEKVYAETGKASPAMKDDWETKANARAQADSKARMVNHGRVNIGGGKFLDQSEIDAIAAAKVQPTLDEITQRVERQRARDEEIRREEEERRRLGQEKAADEKERNLKTKEEWALFKEEEKRDARARKEEEKARKAEEKRLREEETRKAKSVKSGLKTSTTEPKEPVTSPTEAPALDPIPKLEPLGAGETIIAASAPTGPSTTKESGLTTPPTVEPVSATKAVSEDALLTEQPRASEPGLLPAFGDPKTVVARVLSAPVVSKTEPIPLPIEAAKETTSGFGVENRSERPLSTENSERPVAETTPQAKEPADPLSKGIPPPVAATTETRVSGPPTTTDKTKSESKVSSWLKKFSLRTDKSTKTETKLLSKEAPKNTTKAISTGSKLQVASNSATSPVEHDNTIREIAIAGKVNESTAVASNSDADLYDASPKTKARQGSTSPSVSSLSSDEDTRGRSPLRRQTTDSSRGEEFEEARDHFDSEQLAPPTTFAAGRVSDSPVRDSRFQEQL